MRLITRQLKLEQLESRKLLATLSVINNNDSGEGSLREAIHTANATPEVDHIEFALPADSRTIRPVTPLPALLAPVSIDATTQPGYAGKPIVELTGVDIVEDSDGLKIFGGNSTIKGLVINGFPLSGIVLATSNFELPGENLVAGNYIGTNLEGTVAVANGFAGISVRSAKNVIGGIKETDGNLISGNGTEGIRLWGEVAKENHIIGNRIGVDESGSRAIPNARDGVLIGNQARENTIGTDGNGIADDNEHNLISGNAHSGVRIFAGHSNIVAGNWIGLDTGGMAPLPNSRRGVYVDEMGTGNLIGSNADGQSDALERNVISGNLQQGVRFDDSAANNIVSGNYIGTDATGNQSIANGFSGVLINDGSTMNLVGTRNGQFLGNTISGNTLNGVWIFDSSYNTVSGNNIGVNAEGTNAVQNDERGVLIGGGSTNNLVGTDDNNLEDESERNIISGNFEEGAYLYGAGTEQNTVAGNYIGTNVFGNAPIPNMSSGVTLTLQAANNVIGTSAESRNESVAGNVISGNANYGTFIRNESQFNRLAGNTIGLNAEGTSSLPNAGGGVGIFERASNNTIGGEMPIERNLISSNSGFGIAITGSNNNTIRSNWIGLNSSGSPSGNLGGGIYIQNSSENSIGVTSANVIAYNGSVGIDVVGDESTNNILSKNSIFGHTRIGIDLGSDGATANDRLDADEGPHGLQNAPEIIFAQTQGSLALSGMLHSLPDTSFQIEVYTSDEAGLAAQGRQYLGSVPDVLTDAAGNATWSTRLERVENGQLLTVLARAENEGHSEFSAAFPALAALDLQASSLTLDESGGSFTASVSRDDLPTVGELVVQFRNFPNDQIRAPELVVIPDGQFSTEFTIELIDNSQVDGDRIVELIGTVPGIATDKLRFTIIDDDIADWHNVSTPTDVNNDGSTSSIDALLVINSLNSGANRNLSNQPLGTPPIYLDVNADDFVSPLDALLVINFLNSRVGEGEAQNSNEPVEDLWSDLSWLSDEIRRRDRIWIEVFIEHNLLPIAVG